MNVNCASDTANEITSKSPILHMMQITLNRKENMESFLCGTADMNATSTTMMTTTTVAADIDCSQSDGNGNTSAAIAINAADIDANKTSKGVGRRIFKVQAKRFRMETKAAKTLAIIVGGFILCWLPFFTMYLIRAFCQLCIEPLLFSVLFWLGYCNSAINPLIYALFSKDFRIAFKNILYKCLCVHCLNNGDLTNEYITKNLLQHSSGNTGDISR